MKAKPFSFLLPRRCSQDAYSSTTFFLVSSLGQMLGVYAGVLLTEALSNMLEDIVSFPLYLFGSMSVNVIEHGAVGHNYSFRFK